MLGNEIRGVKSCVLLWSSKSLILRSTYHWCFNELVVRMPKSKPTTEVIPAVSAWFLLLGFTALFIGSAWVSCISVPLPQMLPSYIPKNFKLNQTYKSNVFFSNYVLISVMYLDFKLCPYLLFSRLLMLDFRSLFE